ncbi:hypothetical protein PVAP13_2NG014301 [Panicum virgatum]|uniref:Uncharacterized protein n=1 Tax=Panicum virgatum TaxID=38727 RepID=A0A8T0VHS5_PANVG|nr:hypothetical protein PVAP13_2NG014301 [Panicum virgatum]
MAPAGEDQSNADEPDHHIQMAGAGTSSGFVSVGQTAVLNCYPFMLQHHVNQQMGNQVGTGMTFQDMVMRVSTGVLNYAVADFTEKIGSERIDKFQVCLEFLVIWF